MCSYLQKSNINSIKTSDIRDIDSIANSLASFNHPVVIQVGGELTRAIKKLRERVKEFVLKSHAVEEMKFLLEIGKMKETEASNNYNNIVKTLKKKDIKSDNTDEKTEKTDENIEEELRDL